MSLSTYFLFSYGMWHALSNILTYKSSPLYIKYSFYVPIHLYVSQIFTIYPISSIQGVKESIQVLLSPRQGGKRTLLLVAFIAMFLNQTCKVGEQDITVLFVQVGWGRKKHLPHILVFENRNIGEPSPVIEERARGICSLHLVMIKLYFD